MTQQRERFEHQLTGGVGGPTRRLALGEQIAKHARKTPDEVAFTFLGPERVDRTYRQLDERVTRLANALADRGVEAGDRVAVLTLNRLEFVETLLAAARLGAICVPVNFRLALDEVEYVLTDSGAVALVVDADLAPLAGTVRERVPAVTTCLVVGDAVAAAGRGALPYEDALAAASAVPPGLTVHEDNPALIMYTSGTTGRPKGAVLTHYNLLVHSFSMIAENGTSAEDRAWLSAVPLFHIAGVAGMLPYLLLGGRVVVMPSGAFDPVEIVDVLERERISACFFVPTQWQAICAVPGIAERDLTSLKRTNWGAAPAPPSVLRSMAEQFPGAANTTSFGQTECSPVTCILRGEDAISKRGSVGKPIFDVEVRVVDERMNDVPRGEVGEIVYRGPTVMREYWHKPAETAEAFHGGWFHSGDLVREDEDGYFYVVDRKKDMIISGGENIYCAEVEAVLDGHPKVLEVALIGVPDPTWGETPLAVVVPADPADPPTIDELAAYTAGKLASYKRPRRLRTVEALPRNASGKIQKTVLREQTEAVRA